MALVTAMTRRQLQSQAAHTKVECTFDIVFEKDGTKSLQIDTYGSELRKERGKKSQSIRLTASAIRQIRQIIDEHDLDDG